MPKKKSKKRKRQFLKTIIDTVEGFKKFSLEPDFDMGIASFKFVKADHPEDHDDEKPIRIRAIATHMSKDRIDDEISAEAMKGAEGDLLEPGAKTVFFNHDTDMPIGVVEKSKFKRALGGIEVVIKISMADDVKDIRTKIKEGTLSSMSIRGRFKRIEVIHDENGLVESFKILEMELLEASVVGLPMNAKAEILEVIEKSLNGKIFDFLKERSNTVNKNKKETILEVVKEHLDKRLPAHLKEVEETVNDLLEDATDQINTKMDEVLKSIKSFAKADNSDDDSDDDDDDEEDDEEEAVTKKSKKSSDGKKPKRRKKPKKNKKAVDDDDDDDVVDNKEEIPAWAKSLQDGLKKIKTTVSDLSEGRKGHTDDDDDDDDDDDSAAPKKVLKSAEDVATIKYVNWLMNEPEGHTEYAGMSKTEKSKCKGIWFVVMEAASRQQ